MIISQNLRSSIFKDVTANPTAADSYAALLAKSVAVAACHKVAASSDYAQYAGPAAAHPWPGLAAARTRTRTRALAAGAIGGGISGSGPSIFMLSQTEATGQAVGAALGRVFTELGIAFNVYAGPVGAAGARVVAED